MCNGLHMSKPPTLIGSADAEVMLGISRATLSRWVAAERLRTIGRLPGAKGALIFDRSDVERLAAQIAQDAEAARASA